MADEVTKGTLAGMETHPAALDALEWMRHLDWEELLKWQEAFSCCAMEGNRVGEVCGETLERLTTGQPVSDRYLLGLAWVIRAGLDDQKGK